MNCYVVSQGKQYNMPEEVNKGNTLFYPETSMTTDQLLKTGRPKEFHIITDSHFLVPLYHAHEVFVWDGKKWWNPDFQTFGASYNYTLNKIFGAKNTIPQAIIDGKITNVMGNEIFNRKG